jgi:hypothetical protein
MTEYIILWIPLLHKLLLGDVPHTVVATRPAGWVIAADDQAAVRLVGPDRGGSILYFTRAEYDEAMQGLTPAEIDEVIAKRAAAASAVDDGEWAVATGLRRCLARAAVDKQDAYFAQGLAILADLLKDRFKRFTDRELFDAIERGEAQLRAEARGAAREAPEAATRFHDIESGIAHDLGGLAEPAVSLGLPDYRKVELHVDVGRVYFIAPFDPRLADKLKSARAVHVPFDGGVAVQWIVRRVSELGHHVQVLDVGGDRLLDRISRLTRPQLLRDLKRQHGTPVNASSYDAWLDVLLLESALAVHKAAKLFAEHGRSFAPAVVKVAQGQATRLRRRWEAGSVYAAPGTLRACHHSVDATAKLVRTLALAGHDAGAVERMQGVRDALAAMKP